MTPRATRRPSALITTASTVATMTPSASLTGPWLLSTIASALSAPAAPAGLGLVLLGDVVLGRGTLAGAGLGSQSLRLLVLGREVGLLADGWLALLLGLRTQLGLALLAVDLSL